MIQILHIETSTTLCSVGISQNDQLVAKKELNDGYTHAENLGQFIEFCLNEVAISIPELHAVSVGSGPGSYTGLRIGVSTAKGIAYGGKIPLISVPTLQTLASQPELQGFDGLLVPMLDARRLEVFTAVYNAQLKEIRETEALVLQEDAFKSILEDEKVAFVGDGSAKFEAMIGEQANASFFPTLYPSVEGMISDALKKYQRRQFVDVAYFEPFYLKDFVATSPKKLV